MRQPEELLFTAPAKDASLFSDLRMPRNIRVEMPLWLFKEVAQEFSPEDKQRIDIAALLSLDDKFNDHKVAKTASGWSYLGENYTLVKRP